MKLGCEARDHFRCLELPIGVKDEEIARPVEDNASARPVFVFIRPHNLAKGGIHGPVASPVCPGFVMVLAVGQALAIRLGLVPTPFEAFARRPLCVFLGGMQIERLLVDFFADESVAEVFRPALAYGLGFRAFGEHEKRHVSPAARFVEDLAVARLVVDPDRLDGHEFVPACDARDWEPLPVGVLRRRGWR
jgi:hypothetical protein